MLRHTPIPKHAAHFPSISGPLSRPHALHFGGFGWRFGRLGRVRGLYCTTVQILPVLVPTAILAAPQRASAAAVVDFVAVDVAGKLHTPMAAKQAL